MTFSRLHSYLATDVVLEPRILIFYFNAPKKTGLYSVLSRNTKRNSAKPAWMSKGYSVETGSPVGKDGSPGHHAPQSDGGCI